MGTAASKLSLVGASAAAFSLQEPGVVAFRFSEWSLWLGTEDKELYKKLQKTVPLMLESEWNHNGTPMQDERLAELWKVPTDYVVGYPHTATPTFGTHTLENILKVSKFKYIGYEYVIGSEEINYRDHGVRQMDRIGVHKVITPHVLNYCTSSDGSSQYTFITSWAYCANAYLKDRRSAHWVKVHSFRDGLPSSRGSTLPKDCYAGCRVSKGLGSVLVPTHIKRDTSWCYGEPGDPSNWWHGDMDTFLKMYYALGLTWGDPSSVAKMTKGFAAHEYDDKLRLDKTLDKQRVWLSQYAMWGLSIEGRRQVAETMK